MLSPTDEAVLQEAVHGHMVVAAEDKERVHAVHTAQVAGRRVVAEAGKVRFELDTVVVHAEVPHTDQGMAVEEEETGKEKAGDHMVAEIGHNRLVVDRKVLAVEDIHSFRLLYFCSYLFSCRLRP